MRARIITGAIMLGILLPLILIDNVICEVLFAVVAIFISVVGSFEYMNGAYKKANMNGQSSSVLKKYRFVIPVLSGLLCFLACNATYNTFEENDYIYQIYPLLSYITFIAIIFCMMIFTKNSSNSDIGSCIVALTYCGLFIGYAFSLRYFNPININQTIINLNGTKSFMFVYTIVLLTDTFAYLIGCKWGKHKLAPTISPKKSIEGAVGGLVAGTIFGVTILYLYNIVNTNEHIVLVILVGTILSALISCAVQLGDLVESKLKRSFDVKDFGKILPGHGGILDRFDSFIYSGVIFYLMCMFIEIVILG